MAIRQTRSNAAGEDFNKRRMLSKSLINTPFAKPWQFKLKIAGMPDSLAVEDGSGHSVFDLLCKDVTVGTLEIETETVKAGTITLTFPVGTSPSTLSMTMRDHADRRVYDWFKKWAAKVVNKDGTFNLPMGVNGYTRKIEQLAFSDDQADSEKHLDSWIVFPQKLGDITNSVDADGYLEFPIVFVQFNSQR